METCGYGHLSVKQKEKLKSIFPKIVTTAGVDFSNSEIKDIRSAVDEMIKRIKTWINDREVFSISCIKRCGSMAEETAMWKNERRSDQPFIEFDFLAVLQADCIIKKVCQECLIVNTIPANIKLLIQYYRSFYNSCLKKEREQRNIVEECFSREINNVLASCGCLKVKYRYENDPLFYTFKPSSTCSEAQQSCDKCTVERPTGTLRVKTSVEIRQPGTNCSLIFDWKSKAQTLCTRDRLCLPKFEKMDNLTIYIDFLPAYEVYQSNQQSADVAACSSLGLVLNPANSEYEHYCFLVPKDCVKCDSFRYKYTDGWRRSGCRAEIDIFVNEMPDKHRICYKVLKYLAENIEWYIPFPDIKTYHLKTAVLHHNVSCSDAGEDCAECVFKVLDELQHAYKTNLKLFHSKSKLNLDSKYRTRCSDDISILKESLCSAASESDSVSSFIEKVVKLYWRFKYGPKS